MKKYSSLSIALVCAALILTSACQRKIGGNQYSSASVGASLPTFQGVILSVRKVSVSESEKLSDNTAGMGVGALAGGLLGSAFGKGSGKLVGVGVGALAGGAGGMFAQEALGNQEAWEYTVKLSNGEIEQAVQGDETPLQVGQRVLFSKGNTRVRSRVVPDNSGAPVYLQTPRSGPQTMTSPVVIFN